MIYLETDENNVCIGYADFGKKPTGIDLSKFIPVETAEEAMDCMGKRFNNGVWEEMPVIEPEKPIAASEILLAQFYGIELDITPQMLTVALAELPVTQLEADSEWRSGVRVAEGEEITYNGSSYTVIQEHITRYGWEPDKTPTLFKEIREQYSEWKEPAGAHDAYGLGSILTYEGKVWISDVDNNVWRPGEYGWSEAAMPQVLRGSPNGVLNTLAKTVTNLFGGGKK